jgi:hypothetical protein
MALARTRGPAHLLGPGRELAEAWPRIEGLPEPIETQVKDSVAWRVGGQAAVDWITDGTEGGRRITAAIPPLFAAYATLTNHQGAPDVPRKPRVPGLPRDVSSERRQDVRTLRLSMYCAGTAATGHGGSDTSTPAPATSCSGMRQR